MGKRYKLDNEEQELEDNLELCEQLEDESSFRKKIVNAARKHILDKKPITLRVSAHDIEAIRFKASKAGIPYQTYISMLIHKDATSL